MKGAPIPVGMQQPWFVAVLVSVCVCDCVHALVCMNAPGQSSVGLTDAVVCTEDKWMGGW